MNLYMALVSLLTFFLVRENRAQYGNEEPYWTCSTLYSHIGAVNHTVSCKLTLTTLSINSSLDCRQIGWEIGMSAITWSANEAVYDPQYGNIETKCKLTDSLEISLTFATLQQIHFTTTYCIRWKSDSGDKLYRIQIYMVAICVKPLVVNAYLSSNNSEFMPRHTITIHCRDLYFMEINDKLVNVVQLYCSQDGNWVTQEAFRISPNCSVRMCDSPPEIPNSQAIVSNVDLDNFMKVQNVYYKCNPGFSLTDLNTDHLICKEGMWQGKMPSCESSIFCTALKSVENGLCFCESKSDLHSCEPFFQGLHVECVCNEGFTLFGQSIVTCGNDGKWDFVMPVCLKEVDTQNNNIGSVSSSHSHISTLAIVIATACSVLGVLLLVMVVIVFHHRKSHQPRLCIPSSVSQPYSHVNSNLLDDHDRMLLLGYDNCPVALPTYEEAVQGMHHANHIPSRRSGQGQVGEYRPLPNIPTNLRSNGLYSGEINRNSVIMTSTINRDGISADMFGSIDTVNISVSDASTAVTVDTLDSASSHHSNMSRRAYAGSIGSSNGSLHTENFPLLESGLQELDIESVDNKPEN